MTDTLQTYTVIHLLKRKQNKATVYLIELRSRDLTQPKGTQLENIMGRPVKKKQLYSRCLSQRLALLEEPASNQSAWVWSQLCFQSQLLPNVHPGGCRPWLQYLGSRHPCGRPGLSCELLVVTRLRPHYQFAVKMIPLDIN